MTPRPFQSRALDACRAQFRAGKRAVLLVSPTGSGKTCMGAMMVASHVAKGGRVAWLAHRSELVDQAAATLREFGLDVGVRGLSASAPVQVAMRQTLVRRGTAPDATMVIVDECHHEGEGVSWSEILRTYLASGAAAVGLTATPARADGQSLEGFDAIVVAAQIRELQSLGLLVPLRIRAPGKVLGSKHIAQKPVDAYLGEARGRSAVVFAPHLRAAEDYLQDFRGLGIGARMVTGDTPADERREVLGDFAAGRVPVVVNVHVLTEGFDAPRCSCVIVARGCGSQGLWIQMVGRALRPAPGKTDALLLDLRGLTHVHGRPDADRDYALDGEGISLTGGNPVQERLCKVCGAPLGAESTCPECGKEHELVTPKATGEALTDWKEAYEAAKDALQPDRRVVALAGMYRKGMSKYVAANVYRRIFKRYPDSATVAAAHNLNRATDTYGAP